MRFTEYNATHFKQVRHITTKTDGCENCDPDEQFAPNSGHSCFLLAAFGFTRSRFLWDKRFLSLEGSGPQVIFHCFIYSLWYDFLKLLRLLLFLLLWSNRPIWNNRLNYCPSNFKNETGNTAHTEYWKIYIGWTLSGLILVHFPACKYTILLSQ